MRRGMVIAAVLLLTACGGVAVRENNDVVRIDTGDVRGVEHADHLLFQGIPYAKAERWAAPQRAEAWQGVKDTTKPGSPCPQVGSSYSETKSTNEECLFLNVTTSKTATRNKPVMVWIHGDGAIGAGHYFEAQRLAARGDVVVVTFNYRMGVFGGFGMPGLDGSGEFGLLDQRAALEWVRRNAEAFGGDPGNVTLFGVSYGATSASAHLISEQSRGLFHKAVLHSAFMLVDVPAGALYPDLEAMPSLVWRSVEEIEGLGAMIAGELGCADVECLRELPAEKVLEYPQVMNIFQSLGFGGRVLPKAPAESLAQGEFARVPVIAGATRDEHRTFVKLFRDNQVTAGQYPALIAKAFGDNASKILAEYPLTGYESPSIAWATLLTDRVWALRTFQQNQALAAHNPVYAFEFAGPNAEHGADIEYLFPEQASALSDRMIDYWTAFARTGDPNTADLPRWLPFGAEGHVLSLGADVIGPVDYAATHRLDFWQSLDVR